MRKIFLFISVVEGQPQPEILMVNSDSLENAFKETHKKYNGKLFTANYVNSVEVDQLMKDLELPTMTMAVAPTQEEPPKPTFDQLAQLLRDNHYQVTKLT